MTDRINMNDRNKRSNDKSNNNKRQKWDKIDDCNNNNKKLKHDKSK